MAEAGIKKNPKAEKALSRRDSSGLASRGGWDPIWRTPSEFFADPFSVMRHFREEMNRVFPRAFGEEFGGTRGAWSPAIEVTERSGKLQVHADLPGVKPEDVKIEVTDDSLIIEGERKYEHEEKSKGVFRSERRYGKFYREIALPEGADVDQAKAQFKDGVLEIALPVPERKSKRREIPIGTGERASAAGAEQNK